MSYQDGIDALNLKMPKKIPRTEYSASRYWDLINRVTGTNVQIDSAQVEKDMATMKFEKEWDFGFNWAILTHNQVFGKMRTFLGHASYAQGGTDYNNETFCPFEDEDQVLAFDPFEVYGEKDEATLIKQYNDHYAERLRLHPDQVNMTGIYVTMVSGLLEIFGWDMLLLALGIDPDGFGAVANRYADWVLQYFKALAKSDAPVVMIHDDIVWTAGAFVSPDWYRKYIFPNYDKLFEPLIKAGKKIIYTSDGNFTEFVDDVAKAGVHGFVMEPTTDMSYIAKKYGQTHSFVGNADCRILTSGTKEEIRKEVERCVNIGKECPGFIMAVGNHIPSNVPVENAIYYNQCFQDLAYR